MALASGWIKIDRKILDWSWYGDSNTTRVFLHLLLSANIEDSSFHGITVRRGELVTSHESLARALGLSVKNVRTALGHLKSAGEVASKKYPKFQVISILTWDSWQGEVAGETAGKWQASGNIIRIKNKEYNNLLSQLPAGSSDHREAFEHDSLPYRAASWLADSIHERMPTLKPKTEADLQRWAADFDKCNRIDGHSWDEVNAVLCFSQEDEFWQKNILSGAKFRKQYEALLARIGGDR